MNFLNVVSTARQYTAAEGDVLVTTNLINYLDFSNSSCYSGSGSTVNDLVDSLTYTIQGATFQSAVAGGSFSFDGVNDYIISNANVVLSLTELTLGYWIWQNPSETDRNTIFSNDNGSSSRLRSRFNYSPRNMTLTLNGTESYTTAGTSTGTWFYYTVTWDTNGTAYHYVNGSLIESEPSLSTSLSLGRTINIGRNLYPGGQQSDHFWGFLGEVHFYDALLSSTDITTNFNATKTRYGL